MNEEISVKVRRFFGQYGLRKYKKGQVLILEGDEPSAIYFLESGTVKEYDVDYRGEEIVLNLFRPGAFFPMNLALNGGPSKFIFEADTDVDIRQAPVQEVVDFVSLNPEVTMDLLRRVFRGTDALLGRIFQLASGSAKSRLAYELVVAAKRFGEQAEAGYRLEITEKDLAARAGLSRETVSREISKLRTSGTIETGGNHILIPDIGALENLR